MTFYLLAYLLTCSTYLSSTWLRSWLETCSRAVCVSSWRRTISIYHMSTSTSLTLSPGDDLTVCAFYYLSGVEIKCTSARYAIRKLQTCTTTCDSVVLKTIFSTSYSSNNSFHRHGISEQNFLGSQQKQLWLQAMLKQSEKIYL